MEAQQILWDLAFPWLGVWMFVILSMLHSKGCLATPSFFIRRDILLKILVIRANIMSALFHLILTMT